MTNDLDLAVLLEHLKRAQSLFKSFFDGKGNAWISSAIAMLEPHVPEPPDPFWEGFNAKIQRYYEAVVSRDKEAINAAYDALHGYVAADRDLLIKMAGLIKVADRDLLIKMAGLLKVADEADAA